MKLLSILVTALIAIPLATNAHTEPPKVQTTHRVAFEVTMAGAEHWTAVLNNVENLRATFGKYDANRSRGTRPGAESARR
ncbi:MAG: hypothetical protein ACRD5Z_25200 [Bryobacteraceae bacterium]